ncbi:hypothetical protein [Lichenifustis flavocetrariae]|uniref:Uncharacterized protein n=1 Tax=Lichenifustis flavocetrariae TaxID=2949735 RepID=A0AA42CN40_9HYPH|nr:hypothetical protein [Lichenifustis flavocetrariae]MCW6513143.1 hypothetical protein [Lichenifustis flavocetrariae]
MSLELVEGVRKSFLSSGYALGPVSSRCEAAAVAGFTTRFYSLLGVSPEGGST